MPQPETRPLPAERARHLLAGARMATLHTGPRGHAATTSTIVQIDDTTETPLIWLEARAQAVLDLASRRVATLVVADESGLVLQIAGSFHMRRPTESGMRAYQLTPLSIRLLDTGSVTGPVAVPVADFLRVTPDPIASRAALILDHLTSAHGEDLLACVRAHGYAATAVVPRALTCDGLDLTALGPEGVATIRLAFRNAPVRRVEDLDAGLRLPLSCRCKQYVPRPH